jgi:Tat protein secretion system quality control protein TatD with DNase activity
VQKLAELRGWSVEKAKEVVQQNFLRMAGDDDWSKRLIR